MRKTYSPSATRSTINIHSSAHTKRKYQLPRTAFIAAGLFLQVAAAAQETVLSGAEEIISLPELTVTAEGEKAKGDISIAPEALPAQVEIIDAEEIENLPTSNTNFLELFRRTPGVVPRSFGQGDIGEGVNIRGFDSGHGTNVAIFVDGVPINIPNHAHAHGFSNPNWIIPEIIERVEVIKGPFSALYGNFALGGVINVTTKDADKSPSISGEVGSHETYRGVATYSHELQGVTPFLVYEAFDREGYRDNSQNERYNAFNKVSVPLADGGLFSLRAHASKSDFGAPGYIPVDFVRNGTLSRRAAVNDTDGGDTELYDVVASYTPRGENGLHATLYGGADQFSRFATFTPVELGPDNERLDFAVQDQRVDLSDRAYAGWRVFYNLTWDDRASLIAGTDGQYDDGTYRRFGSLRGDISRDDLRIDRRVETLATGVFLQGQIRFAERFKAVGGLRYDRFDTDIENRIAPGQSGDGISDVVSPKFGLSYTVNPQLELFANIGRGFRSPGSEELSPNSPLTPTGFDTLEPLELETRDIGFSAIPFGGFNVTFNYFQTDTDGEISEVTDPVTQAREFRNIGATGRRGYELSFDYFVSEQLSLFASFAKVYARIDEAPPGAAAGDYVTGVPEDSQTFGVTWRKGLQNNLGLIVDGYVQRQGEAPINRTATLYSPSVTRIGVRSTLERGPTSGFLQVLYQPDEFASQAYNTAGSPASGARAAFDPQPEVEVFVGIKYAFE